VNAVRRRPHTAKRRLLDHMVRCDGAWLPEDSIRVTDETLGELEAQGWARVERGSDGGAHVATVTALGRAAWRWGAARVHSR